MHDPISSDAMRRSSSVVNQCLLHANLPLLRPNDPILSGGLPVPRPGCPICPRPVRVLPIPWTVEIPLHVFAGQHRFLCIIIYYIPSLINTYNMEYYLINVP